MVVPPWLWKPPYGNGTWKNLYRIWWCNDSNMSWTVDGEFMNLWAKTLRVLFNMFFLWVPSSNHRDRLRFVGFPRSWSFPIDSSDGCDGCMADVGWSIYVDLFDGCPQIHGIHHPKIGPLWYSYWNPWWRLGIHLFQKAPYSMDCISNVDHTLPSFTAWIGPRKLFNGSTGTATIWWFNAWTMTNFQR